MSSKTDNLRSRIVDLKRENFILRRDNKLLLVVRDAVRAFYSGVFAVYDRNRAINKAIDKFDNRKKLRTDRRSQAG